jgi:F-type H+-transporting ATPase subunit b
MQVVENVALISINATLLVQLGSFLLFVLIFNRVMIQPLRKIMGERRAYLEKVHQEIADANQAYKNIGKQIRSQETRARESAFVLRDETQRTGQQKADEILENTRKEIGALRMQAQKDIAEQIETVRQELHSEAVVIADRMIASLLGRRSAT